MFSVLDILMENIYFTWTITIIRSFLLHIRLSAFNYFGLGMGRNLSCFILNPNNNKIICLLCYKNANCKIFNGGVRNVA